MIGEETDLPPDSVPPGDGVRSRQVIGLEPLPQLVSAAREFVLEQAPELDEETRDTVALLTSELVTNVVIHARTKLRVGVATTDTTVVVTVHDLDVGNSELRPENREGGRGLVLVAALSEAYGLHSDAGGKTAWFRVRRPQKQVAS